MGSFGGAVQGGPRSLGSSDGAGQGGPRSLGSFGGAGQGGPQARGRLVAVRSGMNPSGFAIAGSLFYPAVDDVRVATPLNLSADEDSYRHPRIVLALPPIEYRGVDLWDRDSLPFGRAVRAFRLRLQVLFRSRLPNSLLCQTSGIDTTSRTGPIRAPSWGLARHAPSLWRQSVHTREGSPDGTSTARE